MYIVDTNKNKIYINKFLHLNFFAIHVNWLFWKKKFTDKFLKRKNLLIDLLVKNENSVQTPHGDNLFNLNEKYPQLVKEKSNGDAQFLFCQT